MSPDARRDHSLQLRPPFLFLAFADSPIFLFPPSFVLFRLERFLFFCVKLVQNFPKSQESSFSLLSLTSLLVYVSLVVAAAD